jgi:hypothetical protein
MLSNRLPWTSSPNPFSKGEGAKSLSSGEGFCLAGRQGEVYMTIEHNKVILLLSSLPCSKVPLLRRGIQGEV